MSDTDTISLVLRTQIHRFPSVKHILSFFENEASYWEKVWSGEFVDRHDLSSIIFAHLTLILNSLIKKTPSLDVLIKEIEPFYGEKSWLILSESSDGLAIGSIAETAGKEAAAFAYMMAANQLLAHDASTRDEYRGAVLLSIPELGNTANLGKKLTAERENYRRDNRKQVERVEEALNQFEQRSNVLMTQVIDDAGRNISQATENQKFTLKVIEESGETALQSIKNVEDEYLKQMGLQAPVKYWTDKAKTHRIAEKEAGTRLGLFFPAALVIFALSFLGAAYFLVSHPDIKQAVYVIIGAGLASMGAIIFWIGRLFNRLYLSEHHLRLDAEERAVMTTTYLALINNEAATPEDKPIILNALFRQSSDGFVKDEGPSDVSIAAALSRLGMSKS